jgi:cytochrome b6-f complex iron-sulfur subunit
VTEQDVQPVPTRREFCACCSKAAGLLAIGAVTGCGGGGSPTSPSSNAQSLPTVSATVGGGRQVSLFVAGSSPLATIGGMAIAQTTLGTFLLTRTGTSTVTVVTGTCTHEGCAITGFSGTQFVCPCHGSTFTTAGSVVQGPATRPLQQFAAQLNNEVITFIA